MRQLYRQCDSSSPLESVGGKRGNSSWFDEALEQEVKKINFTAVGDYLNQIINEKVGQFVVSPTETSIRISVSGDHLAALREKFGATAEVAVAYSNDTGKALKAAINDRQLKSYNEITEVSKAVFCREQGFASVLLRIPLTSGTVVELASGAINLWRSKEILGRAGVCPTKERK